MIEQEFREHCTPLLRGLIETGAILTTITLVRNPDMVGVIPQTVGALNDAHGMLRIVPYVLRHKLESYGSLVRKDRPMSLPAQRFLQLLHRVESPAPVRAAS